MDQISLPCFCGTLRRTSRAITQHYDEYLRPSGLKITQYNVLETIRRIPDIRIADIAKGLGMDDTTVTRGIASLKTSGWIKVQTSKHDARAKCARLTESGRRRLALAQPLWEEAQASVERKLAKEVGITRKQLDRLSEQFGASQPRV